MLSQMLNGSPSPTEAAQGPKAHPWRLGHPDAALGHLHYGSGCRDPQVYPDGIFQRIIHGPSGTEASLFSVWIPEAVRGPGVVGGTAQYFSTCSRETGCALQA